MRPYDCRWSQVMARTPPISEVATTLGLLLILISFIFWRMDQRNAQLTKRAEHIMSAVESNTFAAQDVLFNDKAADLHIKERLSFILGRQWSHGQSLRVLFSLMGVIGLAGALFPIVSHARPVPAEVLTSSHVAQDIGVKPTRVISPAADRAPPRSGS